MISDKTINCPNRLVLKLEEKLFDAIEQTGTEFEVKQIPGVLLDSYIVYLDDLALDFGDKDFDLLTKLNSENSYKIMALIERFETPWSSRYEVLLTNNTEHPSIAALEKEYEEQFDEDE